MSVEISLCVPNKSTGQQSLVARSYNRVIQSLQRNRPETGLLPHFCHRCLEVNPLQQQQATL